MSIRGNISSRALPDGSRLILGIQLSDDSMLGLIRRRSVCSGELSTGRSATEWLFVRARLAHGERGQMDWQATREGVEVLARADSKTEAKETLVRAARKLGIGLELDPVSEGDRSEELGFDELGAHFRVRALLPHEMPEAGEPQ